MDTDPQQEDPNFYTSPTQITHVIRGSVGIYLLGVPAGRSWDGSLWPRELALFIGTVILVYVAVMSWPRHHPPL